MGQREALTNLFIVTSPFVVGLVLAFFIANAYFAPREFAVLTLGLYGVGFGLFLLAKLSLVRRGIRVSFGSSRMSPWNRRAYRTGYVLMLIGFVATLALMKVASS